VSDDRYTLLISPTARRQLTERLPEAIAFAAHEFIIGPLLDNPHRVGKRLRAPLQDRHSARRGTYRVIYRIDDEHHRVTVVGIFNRADAYRSR
jgi:mRNA interferase RelE/StbE